jgi:hypothetical protein
MSLQQLSGEGLMWLGGMRAWVMGDGRAWGGRAWPWGSWALEAALQLASAVPTLWPAGAGGGERAASGTHLKLGEPGMRMSGLFRVLE